MDIDFRTGEICLQHNQPIRLSDARDMKIICLDGKIWITAAGEAGDTLLNSGESFRINGKGLVMVESLGAGRIRLVNPPRYTVRQKIHETALRLCGGSGNIAVSANR